MLIKNFIGAFNFYLWDLKSFVEHDSYIDVWTLYAISLTFILQWILYSDIYHICYK